MPAEGGVAVNRWDRLCDRLDPMLERLDRLLDRYEPDHRREMVDFRAYVAFRWTRVGRGGKMVPVVHPHMVDLDDLVGIDAAKEELLRNTEQFVAGYTANNVLLWGERGTGKSSSVKALLKPFGPKGLRIVEVQREDLLSLPEIVRSLRGVPLRFVLFCDDLSFSGDDASYQELKTLLEGGIEERPENLLIYATSNRRHLLPEPMAENVGSEIHPEEAASDRLSLADRFGLTLSFYPFDQETYLRIVAHYAESLALPIGGDDLRKTALRWALYRGQRSGRAARQFVDDLAGRLRLGLPAE
jgi:uncharacterized protein